MVQRSQKERKKNIIRGFHIWPHDIRNTVDSLFKESRTYQPCMLI